MLSVSVLQLNAQQFKEISSDLFVREMKPVIAKMNQANSRLAFKKEIYKDLHSNELMTASSGVIYYGTGKTFRMENEGVTVIQTDDLFVLIDSTEQLVQLATPDTSFNPSASLLNFRTDALLKFKLSSYKTDKYISYKVVPENLADGIIEYQVDLKSNMLYRFKVSYPPANYFSENMEDETLEEPYVIMVYEPIQPLKNPERYFDLKNILVKKAGGEYLLSEQLTNYELHDSRYQPTNQ
jgi:hypothetical protein